jgi:TAP-like protein
LSACAQEPACARRHPELPQTLRRLLQGLPREATLTHPVTGVVETVKVDADVVLATLRMALYVPARAAALPLAIEQAAAGRFDALVGLSMQQGAARRSLNLSLGMHYAVVCAEDQPRAAAAAAAGPAATATTAATAAAAASAAATFGNSFARGYARHCAGLPAASVPEAFYAIPAASTAVLLLSGGIDPATPPRHGERVARALGAQARHVVVPHAGHGTLSLPCLRDVVFRFIDAADDAAAQRVEATCANGIPRPPAFAWPVAPAASEARS